MVHLLATGCLNPTLSERARAKLVGELRILCLCAVNNKTTTAEAKTKVDINDNNSGKILFTSGAKCAIKASTRRTGVAIAIATKPVRLAAEQASVGENELECLWG